MQNYKGIFLKLNVIADEPVISKLDQVKNRQGYIKHLINEDTFIYKKYRKEEINEQCNHHNT
jgi:hypothetical protein